MVKKKKSNKKWLWIIPIVLLLFLGFIFLMSNRVTYCEPNLCDTGYIASEVTCGDGWCNRVCTSGSTIVTKRCEISSFIQTFIPQSSGGTSGGAAGGTDDAAVDEGWTWTWPNIDWPDFDWEMPCFWNCDGTEDTTEPVTKESITVCVKNADCMNICANPTTATCVNGKCNCGTPTTTSEILCVDSDEPGRGDPEEIYVKGTCDDTGFLDREEYTDYCRAATLTEYYCRTDTACSSYTVDCQAEYGTDWGCFEGACVALL